MSIEDEKTIGVILDSLDEPPEVLNGLNGTELVGVFGASALAGMVVTPAILFLFFPSLWLVGIPLGIGLGLFIGWNVSLRVGAKKQGMPSSLFWGLVVRNWQINGINLLFTRVKINFGFIPSQTWDNNSHKDGE